MKYLLIIYGNDEVWNSFDEAELAELIRDTDAHNTSLFRSGELLGAYGVADPVNAKLVRRDPSGDVVTDGPYLETKEHIGSFYIIDVEDEARAVQIAAEMPTAKHRPIEIRPLMHEAANDA
jgi:hypothetical protein